MSNTNKWIFIELAHKGEKTCKFYVINRKSENVIGEIKWYGPWRQYCFFPVIGSVFNPDCMDFICEFIRNEMALRKRVLAKG